MTRPLVSIVVAAALAALFVPFAEAQYRWIDANGKVNFGDMPPPDAKDIKPLGNRAAVAPADSAANLPYELRRAMEKAPVVLYTSPDCPPCAPAVTLLRQRGVPYSERVVTNPADLKEFERISGGMRLPHMTVGSQAQNGFNPDLWTALLDAAGYPKGSMLPRSYQWPAPQPILPPAKPEAKAEGETTRQMAAPAPPRQR